MNPIATNAYRPTSDCIWNAFRSSGKKHLLLTGGRGSGKTTLLGRLFPSPLPGIVTRAVPKKAVYLTDTTTGLEAQIGIFDENLPGRENRMALCREGFLTVGLNAITNLRQSESEWVSIDEIGYLECTCPEYTSAILSLMERKRVAAVVRRQDLPFLNSLLSREDAFVVDLDSPFGNLGCVIMASGMGVRFGGNKLMEPFHGEPMVSRILSATDGIFARRIVVTRHADVAALCKERGTDVILHDLPLRSDTVRLGIEAMQGTDGCIFCAADQPLLRKESVGAIALAAKNEPSLIFRAAHEDTPGSPVLFPKWAYGELHDLPAGKGGGVIATKYPDRVRNISVRDAFELTDADDRETFLRLLSISVN